MVRGLSQILLGTRVVVRARVGSGRVACVRLIEPGVGWNTTVVVCGITGGNTKTATDNRQITTHRQAQLSAHTSNNQSTGAAHSKSRNQRIGE